MSNQKVTTINDAWNEYRDKAIHKAAGEAQLRESKRVFFAAFSKCLAIMVHEVAALPDHEAEAAMDSLMKQCEGFVQAIQMGAA